MTRNGHITLVVSRFLFFCFALTSLTETIRHDFNHLNCCYPYACEELVSILFRWRGEMFLSLPGRILPMSLISHSLKNRSIDSTLFCWRNSAFFVLPQNVVFVSFRQRIPGNPQSSPCTFSHPSPCRRLPDSRSCSFRSGRILDAPGNCVDNRSNPSVGYETLVIKTSKMLNRWKVSSILSFVDPPRL